MSEIMLFHGSQGEVQEPDFHFCNDYNDYGRGFYCTASEELAMEWACKKDANGLVNRYLLNDYGLNILNLTDDKYTVLNWIAILLKNRSFSLDSRIALEAKKYLIENFGIDKDKYDLIIGYRADDSYFRFAESFLQNTLPLRSLNKAMYLGKLGLQTALVSEKAFKQIRFISSSPVDGGVWFARFKERDSEARRAYREEIATARSVKDDLFMIDIMREEIGNNDPRLQRNVLG